MAVTVGAPLVVRRAEFDPAPDHEHLPVGQRRAVERHALTRRCLRGLRACAPDSCSRGRRGPRAAGRASRSRPRRRCWRRCCCPSGSSPPAGTVGAVVTAGAALREDFALDARERRLEVRRRPGQVGELFIAAAQRETGDGDEQPPAQGPEEMTWTRFGVLPPPIEQTSGHGVRPPETPTTRASFAETAGPTLTCAKALTRAVNGRRDRLALIPANRSAARPSHRS